MSETDAERIALDFVKAINRHDVDAIMAMLGPGFRFVDSLGETVRDSRRMREGWQAYFALFPNYRVTVQEHFGKGSVVVLFGTAGGSLAKRDGRPSRGHWRVPAAWRTEVRRGRVVHWQVYADNTPVSKLLSG